MRGSFLFLGTSASAGVPMIGCKCGVCTSASPFNKRMRCAGLVRAHGKSILIDAGPDLHQQAIRFQIDHLDGVILTHTHYDHIAGIDELRIFYVRTKKALPCLLSKESFADLKKRYYYLFEQKLHLSAKFDFHVLEKEAGDVEFLGVPVGYFSYLQGETKVNGYRIGDFAYVSDIQKYDPSIFDHLKGIRTLVISALRPEPSPIHFSFSEAIQFANKVGAKHTWITHVSHYLDHNKQDTVFPPNIQMAYDGLEIEFEYARNHTPA